MFLLREIHVPRGYFCFQNLHRSRLWEGPFGSAVALGPTQTGVFEGVRRKHQITYKAYVPQCYKDHDHKNMSLRRPMSPHLTIYAPTMPAMTSILQRITGVVATFFAILLSGGTLFLPNGVESYVSMLQSMDLSRVTVFLFKIIIGAPFAFHYFNGIRFVLWNAGKFLERVQINETAKKMFIATAISTLFFAIL